MLLRTFALML
uniref:Uncharacterized protein n=1 Tax=Anguilla anguilla TaxID=7936 RepID=A0A0E9UG75_ANGAN